MENLDKNSNRLDEDIVSLEPKTKHIVNILICIIYNPYFLIKLIYDFRFQGIKLELRFIIEVGGIILTTVVTINSIIKILKMRPKMVLNEKN